MVGEHAAVVIAALGAVEELEVVEDAVVGALERELPVVVVLVGEHALHRLGEPVYGRPAAGGVAVPERDAHEVAAGRAQADDYAFFVQPVGVFGHGYVQNGVFFHTYPFTPPAVRPEVMCFWERKKMMSTGSDTIMDAAANTGQEPLVSVACRA